MFLFGRHRNNDPRIPVDREFVYLLLLSPSFSSTLCAMGLLDQHLALWLLLVFRFRYLYPGRVHIMNYALGLGPVRCHLRFFWSVLRKESPKAHVLRFNILLHESIFYSGRLYSETNSCSAGFGKSKRLFAPFKVFREFLIFFLARS